MITLQVHEAEALRMNAQIRARHSKRVAKLLVVDIPAVQEQFKAAFMARRPCGCRVCYWSRQQATKI